MTSAHLCLLFALLYLIGMSSAGTIAPSASASRNLFAADILARIVSDRSTENVIFSPVSIQSCVALAFLGAQGDTAEEIRTALKLGSGDRKTIAEHYAQFLENAFKTTSGEGPQLKMANRIYVNEGLEVMPEFNELASKYFDSQAEQVAFADGAGAVQKINNWVEAQTEKKIRNLLQAGAVNADTSSVLVNAIYFKGKWANPFSQSSTHKANFSISAQQKQSVDMMYNDDKFQYADLIDLDATALALPYENSDLSMLLILPNKVDGLKELEHKLAGVDLNELTQQMTQEDVDVLLPKFKIEFDIDLKQPLQKMGITAMFSDKADFSCLFNTEVPQKVSEVKHKAFLDVNEAGSEAAAATYLKIVPMSLNLQQKSFRADHPFLFAIRSRDAVFFAGHVVKI